MLKPYLVNFLVVVALMLIALPILAFLEAFWLRLLLAVAIGLVAARISRAILDRGPKDPSDVRRPDPPRG